MASQNQAAPWALAIRLEKWKRSKCTKVATSVRVVNSQIAGTATRAFAHSFSRAAINSTGTAAQYAAPRNAAVRGGAMVQAKYVSVCSVSRLSCRPARKTRVLAAYRSHRIGRINDRTPGTDASSAMPDRGDAKPSYEDSSQITGRFAKGLIALLERFLHPNVPDARTDQTSPIAFFLAGSRPNPRSSTSLTEEFEIDTFTGVSCRVADRTRMPEILAGIVLDGWTGWVSIHFGRETFHSDEGTVEATGAAYLPLVRNWGGVAFNGRPVVSAPVFPEKEPEPEGKRAILDSALVIRDDDFERLVHSRRGDTIVCTPIRTPIGTRRGVFVFVEGATHKDLQRSGKPHRLIAVVRRKQTARAEPRGRKAVIVAIEGIGEIPRDPSGTARAVHFS